jgi:hypothetical protein
MQDISFKMLVDNVISNIINMLKGIVSILVRKKADGRAFP